MTAAAAYVLTVVAANWSVRRFGTVPVAPGLQAPAGVYLAGLAFSLRDLVQEQLGRQAVVVCILTGAAVSYFAASGRLALASAVAFLVSELADFAVYTPLRRRGFLLAVACSNLVGLLVDSLLFLAIAFGSLAFLAGQLAGKAWVTAASLVLLALGRRALRARLAL